MQNDVRWLLVDALIKVTLLLALGSAVSLILSRAAAARRHLAWLLTITSALLLPPLCAVLPGWHILPAWSRAPAVVASVENGPPPIIRGLQSTVTTGFRPQNAAPVLVASPPRVAAPSLATEPGQPVARPSRADAPIPAAWGLLANHPITIALLTIWFLGCVFLLGKVLISWLSLRRLARISTVVPGNYLTSILTQAADDLNLRRPVRLLISQDRAMPMTWGIVRPTVLLPADAHTWPRSRIGLVLLHELAHVKRRDALTQSLAQIAGAIYWFQPLIWPAIRGMVRQQESAADDLVLKTQASPAEYAGLLLDLAASLRAAANVNRTAIAMARPFAMEARLRAVLDASRRRSGLSLLSVITALLVTFTIIAPLAALRARAQAVAVPATKPSANLVTYRGHVLSAEGKPVVGAEVVLEVELLADVVRTRSANDGSFLVTGPPTSNTSVVSVVTVAVRAAGLGFGAARMIKGTDNVVELWPSTSVKVTLIGPGDKPVAGIRVRQTFTHLLRSPIGAPR